MNPTTLSAEIFRAVADPTRRAILELLRSGERSAGELARPFRMSQSAISQHLQILRRAGLVRGRQEGRLRLYRLDPRPLEAIREWAQQYRPTLDPEPLALSQSVTHADGASRTSGMEQRE
jgi:DNA-binding transcriptional ArsR family regulator